jgi:ATP-dependent Clp protease ATP-binding subunit ClpC
MFRIVNQARFESNSLGHDWLGCEHLLLGLLHQDDPAARQLTAEGITVEDTRAEVVRIVGARDEPTSTIAPFTRDAERVMEAAERQASLDDSAHVEPLHLLQALLADPDGTHIAVLSACTTELANALRD